ncbi:hypothetical protein [Streptomyces scopuliridis]|uniref:hypothetical protein n=1 Tax=Streptomyces scopuliridis TaxID=452529 RepID=UPI0036858ADF
MSRIELYYDPATGKNCANNVRTASGGHGTDDGWMQIWIARCVAGSRPGVKCTLAANSLDSDYGNYKKYAGPVRVSASGRCIQMFAETSFMGKFTRINVNAVHCG